MKSLASNVQIAEKAVEKSKTFKEGTEFSLKTLLDENTWDELGPENRRSVGTLVSNQLTEQNLAKRIGDTVGSPSRINLYQRLSNSETVTDPTTPCLKSTEPSLSDLFHADLELKMDESDKIEGKPNAMRQKIRNNFNNSVKVASESMISGHMHEGLIRIIQMGREDLSLEGLVLDPKYKDLFSKDILDAAEWRLNEAKRAVEEKAN